VKLELKKKLDHPGSSFILTGSSRYRYGAALRSSSSGSINPIYVSPGHRVSLDTALKLTKLTNSNFRIPEPIRQADQLSRRMVAEYQGSHSS
jgi:deoxyinosine 3'endonuclease (endonuclease V)